ncbi:glycosyltransferase family 2 protein [Dyella sp.]|uniref:glycosyltransferase family 2 protein n=1 Tax=Dyella sp. TaxID=1869338 RepID=UPI002B497931|nr:glycosyltransferase family 2 protein [Dyella sp.]HKT27919.1 glycosyltransferase family 2 protein [Dyella sp.]
MSALDPAKPQVSVIIVSADSGPSLRDCVKSVLACTTPLEVLLIDNASTDSIPQAIARARESDPRFKVIYNHANLGFGPAINRAAAQAHGEALLILNPDCLITQDALQRLLDVLTSEKKAGLVGAVVCDAQGVPDPASFRRDPVLGRALATLLGRKGGVNAQNVPDQVVEAEAVSGAVMLMPLRVFELLHGFDENYFLHCEDLDLCRRVRDAGWRVLLAGDVRVLHGKGGSSRHRPVFVSYHKHRGMWRWFRKFDPASRNPLTAAVVWLGIWSRFLLKVPGQWLRAARR